MDGTPIVKAMGHDLNANLLVGANARHNAGVVAYIRVFIALVGGVALGISGVSGWKGLGLFLALELLGGGVLMAKCGGQSHKYFQSWQGVWVDQVFTSVTLLTFLLFWTVTNNLIYLF